MSSAFRCDRCGDYQDGSGTEARFGSYKRTFAGRTEYDFLLDEELCDDCWEGLVDVVESYMEDVRIDERE